jgi:hypothetical protein
MIVDESEEKNIFTKSNFSLSPSGEGTGGEVKLKAYAENQ